MVTGKEIRIRDGKIPRRRTGAKVEGEDSEISEVRIVEYTHE